MPALLLGRVPVASKHANEAQVFLIVAIGVWSEDDRRFVHSGSHDSITEPLKQHSKCALIVTIFGVDVMACTSLSSFIDLKSMNYCEYGLLASKIAQVQCKKQVVKTTW